MLKIHASKFQVNVLHIIGNSVIEPVAIMDDEESTIAILVNPDLFEELLDAKEQLEDLEAIENRYINEL